MKGAHSEHNVKPRGLRQRVIAVWQALAAIRQVRRSVTGKLMLIVLLTTAIALSVAGLALLFTDLRDNRESWARELATEASILSLSTAPALSFDDRAGAQRNLAALKARDSVLAAALYSSDGSRYADYVRRGETPAPPRIPAVPVGVRIDGEQVALLQPIVQNGERLGSIYIVAHYDRTGRVRAYLGILAIVMILSLGVALLASGWFQSALTGPMDSIAAVARQIVERRDYSLRATKTTGDEIGVVIDAFNSMLDEVQARTRALEDSNQALQEQITVRLAAENALRDSERSYRQISESLREADRRKDEFLATLAHELRNPLAPIRNAVAILGAPAATDGQRLSAREVIGRQVRHMALLLDDLLDLSRITRGQLELRKEYVDLGSILDVAVETARPLIDAKRHTLTVRALSVPVQLEADPLRLSQVIANLLTNAAKYTDPGGAIALSASVADTQLVVSVKDSGIGLSAAAIPRLFTMFSQVNSAVDRAEGGLGIGLALVKGLIALHGGTVEAASGGLGCGSEFIVRLPRAVLVQKNSTGEAIDPADAPRLRRHEKILVADDNRDSAITLAALLELAGYRVVTAFSGAQALEVGARERPDGALLDIGMPGMSGYEVARRIRLEAWGHNALLVALTGWGQDADKHKALAAGFDEHLTKPVDSAELERLLSSRLAKSPPQT